MPSGDVTLTTPRQLTQDGFDHSSTIFDWDNNEVHVTLVERATRVAHRISWKQYNAARPAETTSVGVSWTNGVATRVTANLANGAQAALTAFRAGGRAGIVQRAITDGLLVVAGTVEP